MLISLERSNFLYYKNDAAITRADREKKIFETRSFRTGEWKPTQDMRLIEKMLCGKGQLPSEATANTLFERMKIISSK